MSRAKIASREEWLAARLALLEREKEHDRRRDALSAARRELPWVRVDKAYVFDAPSGKLTLRELFGERRQLLVYHFMFAPSWDEGCKSCSYVADNIQGGHVHLAARDTAYCAVSRAPLARIEAFKGRMGWTFPWVSSGETDFNYDYHVSFREEERARGDMEYNFKKASSPFPEAPGLSVFAREGDEVFHTYSTYARGLDVLIGTYNYLDLTPLGRDEAALPYTMAWVRHHDRYPTTSGTSRNEAAGEGGSCGCAAPTRGPG
ncbi:DUF899 domain-containing protein [Sorangium sp. So ce327]|jgi:predicted dithiol-disulfide oxidoreductase (DUF899 family)|uniref:DUF899 domain-containing protein n=1 Tax=unclassified Sorangium TaxID=2621164 RepID=UPI003F5E954C